MTAEQLLDDGMTTAERACISQAIFAIGPARFCAIVMESTELDFITSHILDSIRRNRLDQRHKVSSATVMRKYREFVGRVEIAQALGILPSPNDDILGNTAPRFQNLRVSHQAAAGEISPPREWVTGGGLEFSLNGYPGGEDYLREESRGGA